MNKLTLSKIKMKGKVCHWFLKTKDQRDCQMYAKYGLAEKQLQIMKNAC